LFQFGGGRNCTIFTKIGTKLRKNKNTRTKLRMRKWHLA